MLSYIFVNTQYILITTILAYMSSNSIISVIAGFVSFTKFLLGYGSHFHISLYVWVIKITNFMLFRIRVFCLKDVSFKEC